MERTYQIAEDFAAALSQGSLATFVVEAARARIEKLLAITPQYDVETLDKDTLLQHAELAIACAFEAS
jgi:beta-N-acetylhexosaminidase